ncbi:MAG: hypothetical protein ACRDZ3_09450, partial [Acidimicrobiia bacterium]
GDDNITVVVIDALADGPPEGAAASAALGGRVPDDPTGEWVAFDEEDEFDAEMEAGAEIRADAEVEAEEPPAPAVAVPAEPGAGPIPPVRVEAPVSPKPRRAGRALAWLLPVFLLLGAGAGALSWYARRTYYVGLAGERVALYRGVPGGVLGWDPTVERTSNLSAGDLTPAQRADLEDGHRFANKSEAQRFLQRLEDEQTPDEPVIAEPPPFDVTTPTDDKTPSTIR